MKCPRRLKRKREGCFSRWKCNRIAVSDPITSWTSKTSINKLLRSRQTTKKVPPNIIRGFKVRKKVRLMFWRPKHSMKGKSCAFNHSKQRNKLSLAYLQRKLPQDWCIFKLKCQITVERTDKQTTSRVPLMFLDLKVLSKMLQLRFWTLSTNKEGAVYVFSVKKAQNKQ